MRRRFLAICGSAGSTDQPRLERAFALALGHEGLEPLVVSDALNVVADADCPRHIFPGGRGCAVGRLFRSDDWSTVPGTLSRDEATRLWHRGPAELLTRYWGGYAAFAATESAAGYVLRDPSGVFPIYSIGGLGAAVFVSDAALARELGLLEGRVDWDRVAEGLLLPDLRLSSTALRDCAELLPGEAIDFKGSPCAAAWTPADHVHRGAGWDVHESAARLRDTIQRSIGAWARDRRRIVLELSGGLDSSIIAACLARSGADLTCLTMATPTPDGDERTHARAVAHHLGVPLMERFYDPAAIDFRKSSSARLPRPSGAAFAQASDAALLAAAAEIGADCFFNGGGGDNVFCSIASATPAIDRLLARGPGPSFVRALADVAAIHHTTFWHAAGAALRNALGRSSSPWPIDRRLLAPALVPEPVAARHPWLAAGQRLPPGKYRHVQSILAIHNHLEGHDRGER
ncbi:MAG TPA: asparagine synthase-related protein [Allosphingosinicella sp.]|jgi:asparagine synthase (glutamine-hydrolysing)